MSAGILSHLFQGGVRGGPKLQSKCYMEKRVIIVHGWSGHPQEGWLSWLRGRLEEQGDVVETPEMPHPDKPVISTWVQKLSEIIREPDENLILVGHSIGCQTILRYLASLPSNAKLAGVVLVAPWAFISGLSDEDKIIAEPWLKNMPGYPDVDRHLLRKPYAIFSDNDPYVPLEDNVKFFKDRYGAEIFVENGRGHFTEDDGVEELPSALEAVKKISTH